MRCGGQEASLRLEADSDNAMINCAARESWPQRHCSCSREQNSGYWWLLKQDDVSFWAQKLLEVVSNTRPLLAPALAPVLQIVRTEDSGQRDASSGWLNISPNFGSLYNPVQKYFSESRHAELLLKRSALHIRYFNISIIKGEVGTWTWIYNFSGHIKMHLGY